MTRRMIAPLLFGVLGVAVLVWLGVWQVQRLAWKTAILAEIDAKLAPAPVAVPADPAPGGATSTSASAPRARSSRASSTSIPRRPGAGSATG